MVFTLVDQKQIKLTEVREQLEEEPKKFTAWPIVILGGMIALFQIKRKKKS